MQDIQTEFETYGFDFIPHTGYFHESDADGFYTHLNNLSTPPFAVWEKVGFVTNVTPSSHYIWNAAEFEIGLETQKVV